jgi:nucleoside-diphosphate-sugar epimerase
VYNPLVAVTPSKAQPATPDGSPSRYIAKISARTGLETHRDIEPEELLVHAHRDKHPVEVAVQFLASRLISLTGNEDGARRAMRAVNQLGTRAAEMLGAATGSETAERQAKKLIGVMDRDVYFRFRETNHISERDLRSRVARLQAAARQALKARGRNPRLHVLLTGATGFLGKEILVQAAGDRRIEQLTAVVRPEKIRHPRTREVVRVLSPQQRGALLLKRLYIPSAQAGKFRFITGDIEKPDLGIEAGELEKLRRSLTHMIHCAASVSFDDTYENSYRANVLGSLNALRFSLGVQQAEGSQFIQHVAIETSYIHGRKKASIAQEGGLAFPRHFYNNFYELTKAMASIETDRAVIEKGLRVAQLLPSIVIGHSRTGNNYGDTKVLNAPINAFGRSKDAVLHAGNDLAGKLRARLVSAVAQGFPADPSAELNLVPVDRVVQGILAVLTLPEAIGVRIHLATDNRIRSDDIVRIVQEELGVSVRLADPTLFRNLTLPLAKAALNALREPKLAGILEKLGTIFAGYGEWGQPIHEIGNDVRILGLPLRRPDTEHAFRMLCRHNRYLQDFGKVRDPDEIARRERVWTRALDEIELATGHEAAAIPAERFQAELSARLDLRTFRARRARRRAGVALMSRSEA